MVPRQIIYWLVLIVTVVAAIWAITSFANIADQVETSTPVSGRGLLPTEETKLNNSL